MIVCFICWRETLRGPICPKAPGRVFWYGVEGVTQVQKATALSVDRLTALDALRGLIMMIMALDHTRDFIHVRRHELLARGSDAHDADHLSHPLGHAHLRAGLHVQRRRWRISALATSGTTRRRAVLVSVDARPGC